jgi:hypothetical protein
MEGWQAEPAKANSGSLGLRALIGRPKRRRPCIGASRGNAIADRRHLRAGNRVDSTARRIGCAAVNDEAASAAGATCLPIRGLEVA